MPYSPLPVKSFQSVCQIIGIQHFSKNARMSWSSWICVHIFRFLASLLLTFWVYWNAWKALQEIVKNYRLLLWWRRIRIHERVHPFIIPSRKIPYANKHCIPLCLTISISAEKDIEQFSLERSINAEKLRFHYCSQPVICKASQQSIHYEPISYQPFIFRRFQRAFVFTATFTQEIWILSSNHSCHWNINLIISHW